MRRLKKNAKLTFSNFIFHLDKRIFFFRIVFFVEGGSISETKLIFFLTLPI